MPYNANISQAHPILFVLLLDQSGSMSSPLGESGMSKAEVIADIVNNFLAELVMRGTKGYKVNDYCEVAILGYGAQQGYVLPGFSGNLSGKEVVRISEIGNFPARTESKIKKIPDGAGGITEISVQKPIWFEPTAGGDTPMTLAFQRAYDLISRWVVNHSQSYPPIVINITDGEPTDGDPTVYAEQIKNLRTSDGNVLLFNCYISSNIANPILFPDSKEVLKDSFGKKLFEMSSILPQTITETARQNGLTIGNNARGFVYQAGLKDVVQFVEVGTRPVQFKPLGTRPVDIDFRSAQKLFGDRQVFVVDSSSSEIILYTPNQQKLTPVFLFQTVSPYLVAIAEIQKVFDEISAKKHEVIVRIISQNSPISVSLDGASEAIKTVQDNVVAWRRENAKRIAQLSETEKEISIEVLKAETLEKRANAAKSRAEADKIIAEAEKQRQETEQLKLENEKRRIEVERAKIQLALDILDRIAPNLTETEKIAYVVKLLPPLDVVALSSIEVQPKE